MWEDPGTNIIRPAGWIKDCLSQFERAEQDDWTGERWGLDLFCISLKDSHNGWGNLGI